VVLPLRKNEIAVGVIGAGYIAQQSHIPAYLMNPHVRILGVADPDKNKLEEVKKKFGIQDVFSDYSELLAKGPDAVSICVPTKFHSKITIDAATKGVHVLCEKPIALTLAEANEMIVSCEKNHAKLMIGFNYRYIRTHQEARKMINDGKIGKPYFIQGQFASTGPYKNIERMKNSFYFDPKGGGGVMFDSGSHLFDLMRWYFGEIDKVQASVGTYMDGIPVEDVASVSLKFNNGRVGCLTCMWTRIQSWSAMGSEGFIKVIGDEGKIVASLFSPSIKFFSSRSKMARISGEIEIVPKGFDPKSPMDTLQRSWSDEIEAFIEAVRTDKEVPITGQDGRRVLELILQAYGPLGRKN
jgi:UDP-N-acetylglucosamine 3-dehydrogenase